MALIVIAPDEAARALTGLGDDVVVLHYHSGAEAARALDAAGDGFVIVSDRLHGDDLQHMAEAVRRRARPCIEVRSGAWDGSSFSALSAACRGVISGFGTGAVREALALLR